VFPLIYFSHITKSRYFKRPQ